MKLEKFLKRYCKPDNSVVTLFTARERFVMTRASTEGLLLNGGELLDMPVVSIRPVHGELHIMVEPDEFYAKLLSEKEKLK